MESKPSGAIRLAVAVTSFLPGTQLDPVGWTKTIRIENSLSIRFAGWAGVTSEKRYDRPFESGCNFICLQLNSVQTSVSTTEFNLYLSIGKRWEHNNVQLSGG
jgi:hypothetical protein